MWAVSRQIPASPVSARPPAGPAGPRSRPVWWTLLVLWAATVWWLSAQTDPGETLSISWKPPDWLAHGIEYAAGGFLAYGATAPTSQTTPNASNEPGLSGRRSGLRAILTVLVIGVGWGLVDEIHQAFVPGRHTSGMDLAADGLGTLAGALVCRALGLPAAGRGLSTTQTATPHGDHER